MSSIKCKSIDQLEADDSQFFGNKAWQLAQIEKLGFTTPKGLAISLPLIDNSIDKATLESIQNVVDNYLDTYPQSNHVVRSSSCNEDSKTHSYAGFYKTYLDLTARDEIINAIKLCYEHAKSMTFLKLYDQSNFQKPFFGIIIQPQIFGQYSGVCFSSIPEKPDSIAIEYTNGPCQSVVTGNGQIIREYFSNDQAFSSFRMSHKVAKSCFDLATSIGYPIDVEWTINHSKIVILQARPIVSPQSEAQKAAHNEEIRLKKIASLYEDIAFTDYSIGDVFGQPSRLFADLLQFDQSQNCGVAKTYRDLGFNYCEPPSPIFDTVVGRAYINLSAYRHALLNSLPIIIKQIDEKAELKLFNAKAFLKWTNLKQLSKLLILSFKVVLRFFSIRKNFADKFQKNTNPYFLDLNQKERSINWQNQSSASLVGKLIYYTQIINKELTYHHLMSDLLSVGSHGLISILLKISGSHKDDLSILSSGLKENPNCLLNMALFDISQHNLDINSFKNKFGHRAHPDWDLAATRFHEDEELIMSMVEITKKSKQNPYELFETQVYKRMHKEKELWARLLQKSYLMPFRRLIFSQLRIHQQLVPLREQTQNLIFRWIELIRLVLAEIGRRTQLFEDIYQLTFNEIIVSLQNPVCINKLKKKAIDNFQKRRHLLTLYAPSFLFADHIKHLSSLKPSENWTSQLKATPIIKGVVRGRARVVVNLHEAKTMSCGEILVARYTDPAWAPLLLMAAGLILEQGSAFSHGSILARELGLPTVIEAKHATNLIKNGDMIELDGTNGFVNII